jgi:hypothetical protein
MHNLDKHSLRDKGLLALERERNRLYKAKWNAPLIPVEKPYQAGWERKFILRDDAARRAEAPIWKQILAKFNLPIFSRDKRFLDHEGHEIVQQFKVLPKKQVEAFPGWTAQHFKWLNFGHHAPVYFHFHRGKITVTFKDAIEGYYPVITGYYLVLDIQPYIVTHMRVHMPEVEQRLAYIEKKLDGGGGIYRLNKLHGQRSHWRDPRQKRNEQLDPKEWIDEEF